MSALSDTFIASLRLISAERREERAELTAVREQVSVLLELTWKPRQSVRCLDRRIDTIRAEWVCPILLEARYQ